MRYSAYEPSQTFSLASAMRLSDTDGAGALDRPTALFIRKKKTEEMAFTAQILATTAGRSPRRGEQARQRFANLSDNRFRVR